MLVVIKGYFATWCPHCIQFKPYWLEFKKMALAKGYKVEEFISDKSQHDNDVISQDNVQGFPTIFVFIYPDNVIHGGGNELKYELPVEHNLNNLMTKLTGFVKNAVNKIKSSETGKAIITEGKKSAQNMLNITNNEAQKKLSGKEHFDNTEQQKTGGSIAPQDLKSVNKIMNLINTGANLEQNVPEGYLNGGNYNKAYDNALSIYDNNSSSYLLPPDDFYYHKYLKYKQKYLQLLNSQK